MKEEKIFEIIIWILVLLGAIILIDMALTTLTIF